jgi:chorismate dehydratase
VVQKSVAPRIGCVKYINARPLVDGWQGPVEFDHPSALCRRLAAAELDVALVSSFEFLRNPIYSIVDQVAIASDGPVYSVFVAHERDHEWTEVEIDPASRTAAALLRCLLREQKKTPDECAPAADNLSPLDPGRSRLLIGDQAIRFRQKFATRYDYLDLGQAWRDLTGFPFVFALWLVRPEVAEARETADRLRALRDHNLAHLDELISEPGEFSAEFRSFYYRDCLRFDFAEKEKAGLEGFRDLCAVHGLLEHRERNPRLV